MAVFHSLAACLRPIHTTKPTASAAVRHVQRLQQQRGPITSGMHVLRSLSSSSDGLLSIMRSDLYFTISPHRILLLQLPSFFHSSPVTLLRLWLSIRN